MEENPDYNFLEEISYCFHEMEFNGKQKIVYGLPAEKNISDTKKRFECDQNITGILREY
jgi:hypothetical protein